MTWWAWIFSSFQKQKGLFNWTDHFLQRNLPGWPLFTIKQHRAAALWLIVKESLQEIHFRVIIGLTRSTSGLLFLFLLCSLTTIRKVTEKFIWSSSPQCEINFSLFLHPHGYDAPVIFIYLFICLFIFLAALGLRCCTWAFSSCGELGLTLHCGARSLGTRSSVAVARGLSSCGSRA